MTSCSPRCRPGSPCMVSRDGCCEQPASVYVPTNARRKAELTAIAEAQGTDLPAWSAQALEAAAGRPVAAPGLAEQIVKLRAALAAAHRYALPAPFVLAIDPGPVRSGVVGYDDGRIAFSEPAMLNGAVLSLLEHGECRAWHQVCAIETMQATYAATVGEAVINTLIWIGEFKHAWRQRGRGEAMLLSRQRIKDFVCNGNTKAKDSQVRTALIDRCGPPGTKRAPGPTYGVTSHAWSALAVAVTAFHELATAAHASPADAVRARPLPATNNAVARGDESARATA